MLRHDSVPTIKPAEFINLNPLDLNRGISSVEIKLFYLGQNRNGSVIERETAVEMAKTLRGAPIVAHYDKEKKDFGDHGGNLGIDEDGNYFITPKTIPYGFISTDSKVAFKDYDEYAENGDKVTRTYLVATGYIWTGRYPEITKALTSGLGQSMELDPDTMTGRWTKSDNELFDVFIIDSAEISAACILGDDVEPCFEGAAVTDRKISKEFELDENPVQTFFTMVYELKNALKERADMENEILEPEQSEEIVEVEEAVVEAPATEEGAVEDEFVKKDEEDEKSDAEDDSDAAEDEEKDEDKKPSENHSIEEVVEEVVEEPAAEEVVEEVVDYSALISELDSLRSEVAELRQFKLNAENAEKDAVIAKYFMLSDADKAEVIENKEQYSLEEIDAKLALAYVRANVNFDSIDGQEEVEEEVAEEDPITSFSLESDVSYIPPVVAALRQVAKN